MDSTGVLNMILGLFEKTKKPGKLIVWEHADDFTVWMEIIESTLIFGYCRVPYHHWERLKKPGIFDIVSKCLKSEDRNGAIYLSLMNQSDQPAATDQPIIESNSLQDVLREVVDYMNKVCNTGFRYSNKKTKTLLKALLNQHFTMSEIKTVIDKKAAEWMGTPNEIYLRPETLFGNKFEGYLNQKITAKGTKEQNTIDKAKNIIKNQTWS